MLFLCVILHTMSSGKSLQLLCILPFGMLCLSAISMMFVKILLAVCMLVGITTMPPLQHQHTRHTSSLQLHPHTHHIVTPGFVDRPRRSDCTAGQMDGEAGWWTTCGNIGLPPLARVMGVGRQQQQLNHSLITTRLDFCNIILYNLPDNQIEILQRIQNQTARMLIRIPRRNQITPVLRELHWLKIHDIFFFAFDT